MAESTLPTSTARPHRQVRETRGLLPLLYLLINGGYALLFQIWRVGPVPTQVHLLAVLLFAICLIPLFRWYARGADDVPIFELIVFSYAMQFSMPVYVQPNYVLIFSQRLYLSWDTVASVLQLTILGVTTLIGSYALARRLPLVRLAPQLDIPLEDPQKKRAYILGALLVGGVISFLQAMGGLGGGATAAIFLLLGRQMQVAIVLLAYDHFRNRQVVPAQRVLLYGAVAMAFITGLLTGLLENALIPLVLVTLVFWHARRRMPWGFLALGVLLYLILNPAKFAYRSIVWYGSTPTTITQRVDLWAGLATESAAGLWGSARGEQSDSTIYDALARFDLVHKFAYVYTLTPAYIPYYNGNTYEYFLYAWIPRLLWPDKPAVSANERIDIDYRLKAPRSSSNIGIGQLPEAYVNFGLAGILAVMSLQGVIFALLDSTFNSRRSDGGRGIYLTIMVFFLNGIGSAAAVLFGAIFQQILANMLLMRPFTSGFSRTDELDAELGSPATATIRDEPRWLV